MLRLGRRGKYLLKRLEAWMPEPYLDSGGQPTIGWGFTHYGNGIPVTMSDPAITIEQGEEIFLRVLDSYEQALTGLIRVPLNQFQVDALLLFMYNVGIKAFTQSTLLKRVNADPFHEDIPRQWMRWIYDNGERVWGLVKRRRVELNLYYSEPDPESIPRS